MHKATQVKIIMVLTTRGAPQPGHTECDPKSTSPRVFQLYLLLGAKMQGITVSGLCALSSVLSVTSGQDVGNYRLYTVPSQLSPLLLGAMMQGTTVSGL